MKFCIVTHNVLRMQGLPEFALVEGGPPDVIETLARLYLALKPQILCLQEVQFAEDAQRLAELLGMGFRFEPGGVYLKYGGAVFVDPKSPFIYKPISRLRKGNFERVCQLVEVRLDNCPVTICNLHLPSGVRHPEDGGENARMREIAEVISFTPDIIVGDMNAEPGSSVYRKLQKAGYVDAAVEAGMENIPTCGRMRIDYIWIHSRACLKLEGYEVVSQAGTIGGDVVRSLSDHLPVSAALTIGGSKG